MKKYAERIDALIDSYGGRGKLNETPYGYEFIFGDSKEDSLSWNGDDFVGVKHGKSEVYIPLSLLVFREDFE